MPTLTLRNVDYGNKKKSHHCVHRWKRIVHTCSLYFVVGNNNIIQAKSSLIALIDIQNNTIDTFTCNNPVYRPFGYVHSGYIEPFTLLSGTDPCWQNPVHVKDIAKSSSGATFYPFDDVLPTSQCAHPSRVSIPRRPRVCHRFCTAVPLDEYIVHLPIEKYCGQYHSRCCEGQHDVWHDVSTGDETIELHSSTSMGS